MIKAIKHKVIGCTEYWFSEIFDSKNSFNIIFYRQSPIDTQLKGYRKELFITLISNLTLTQEELLKKCSPTIRNEINRSIKENIIVKFNDSIDNFIPFYNNFASQKGLIKNKKNDLTKYGNNLFISSAFCQNSQLCSHSYIIDHNKKRVRLLQSATMRFSETIDHNLIGRANKYLHFRDMIYFKEQGLEQYDWGGIAANSTDKSLIGINKFKMSFGGEERTEYNYTSTGYNLLISIKKLLKKIH